MAKPDAARVVGLVMKRLGLTKPEELAELCELPAYRESSPKMARRWIGGEVAPSFEYTMRMLSKGGLLDPDVVAAWRGVKTVPPALERQATPAVVEKGSRRRAG